MSKLPPKLESYYGRPVPRLDDMDIKVCYLCGELLGDAKDTDQDHIIPRMPFASGSANRPYLMVHKFCNRTKSLQDEKFALRLALSAHRINTDADAMVHNWQPNGWLMSGWGYDTIFMVLFFKCLL